MEKQKWLDRQPIGVWRNAVQVAFAVFLLYLGWRFYLFVQHFTTMGAAPVAARPAGVEGFLPISALMALRQWVGTGVWDPVHPAGLAIFLAILLTALLVNKGFCSWLCPIGALSEALSRMGVFFWGRRLVLPVWLDRLLMLPKYLILGFFVKVIFWDMPMMAVTAFLSGPYNAIADVKMLQFFLDLSPTALSTLGVLAVLSVVFYHFWCRYLCPYGALLGIVSWLSPHKVTRDAEGCLGCRRCDRACPSALGVSSVERVASVECTACLSCVEACPQPGVLAMTGPGGRWRVKPQLYPLLLLAVFLSVVLLAKATGRWETVLTAEDYYYLIPRAKFFGH